MVYNTLLMNLRITADAATIGGILYTPPSDSYIFIHMFNCLTSNDYTAYCEFFMGNYANNDMIYTVRPDHVNPVLPIDLLYTSPRPIYWRIVNTSAAKLFRVQLWGHIVSREALS